MRPLGDPDFQGSFQGLLLVAHPGLKDPNFRRSVLLLSAHEAETGAFGLILNRPLGKTADELLPEHDQRELLARVPVYLGGPVAHDQLSFADLRWDGEEGGVQLQHNLTLDQVAERIEEAPGSVRAFVGYAGWSAGQLENELLQKAWVLIKPQAHTVAAQSHAVEPAQDEKLWLKIMSALGPTYKLLAAVPDDPSLN